jgi:hypothetical protein
MTNLNNTLIIINIGFNPDVSIIETHELIDVVVKNDNDNKEV